MTPLQEETALVIAAEIGAMKTLCELVKVNGKPHWTIKPEIRNLLDRMLVEDTPKPTQQPLFEKLHETVKKNLDNYKTPLEKSCMNCGTSGCDHKDAMRCSNGHSLWTPENE